MTGGIGIAIAILASRAQKTAEIEQAAVSQVWVIQHTYIPTYIAKQVLPPMAGSDTQRYIKETWREMQTAVSGSSGA